MLPICANTSELAATAAANGIVVSFYNSAATGQYAGEIMRQLKKDSVNAGFTFSPAAFARCGEKPFLQTYRIGKFRKHIDQLDIEDGTFTGVPAKLARGNAELKELVSILRCSGFSGFMTLSAANRAVGNIAETAAAFRKLLAEI
jgi:sugar phosphate isomerase/epimerase